MKGRVATTDKAPDSLESFAGTVDPQGHMSGYRITAACSAVIALTLILIPWGRRVTVEVRLSPNEFVSSVRGEADGNIIQLRVADGQRVEAGEIVAVVSDTVGSQRLPELRQEALRILRLCQEGRTVRNDAWLETPEALKASYASLRASVDRYSLLSDNNYVELEAATRAARSAELRRQMQILNEQVSLVDRSAQVSAADYQMRLKLRQEGWGSLPMARDAERRLIEENRRAKEVRQTRMELSGAIAQLSRQSDLDRAQRSVSLREARTAAAAAAGELVDKLDAYEARHGVRARTKGQIAFIGPVKVGDYVRAGQDLAVVAEGAEPLAAVGQIGFRASGGVAPGQRAEIELPGFPRAEYGHLEGVVAKTWKVEGASGYSVMLRLQNGWRTNRGISIPPRVNQRAIAHIHIDSDNLLDRMALILGGVRNLMRRQPHLDASVG